LPPQPAYRPRRAAGKLFAAAGANLRGATSRHARPADRVRLVRGAARTRTAVGAMAGQPPGSGRRCLRTVGQRHHARRPCYDGVQLAKDQPAAPAVRTAARLRRFEPHRRCYRHDQQQAPAQRQADLTLSVRQQTIVANLHKALGANLGQDVLHETPQALDGIERHRLLLVCAGVGFVAERDSAVARIQQPRVTDGDAMGIPSQVLQDLLRAAERWFAINDLLLGV